MIMHEIVQIIAAVLKILNLLSLKKRRVLLAHAAGKK
jgi:hypothetical protein